MRLLKREKKSKNGILTVRFNDYSEAHNAQQILKDLGYSEGAVRVFDLSQIVPGMEESKEIDKRNKVLISGTILISLVFITIAFLSLSSIFSLLEIVMVILVWVILMAVGAIICCLIGGAVWKLINSKAISRWLEAIERQKILIGVKLRNPDDAGEIEQVWRKIGGDVV
jgi:hypothetical protein